MYWESLGTNLIRSYNIFYYAVLQKTYVFFIPSQLSVFIIIYSIQNITIFYELSFIMIVVSRSLCHTNIHVTQMDGVLKIYTEWNLSFDPPTVTGKTPVCVSIFESVYDRLSTYYRGHISSRFCSNSGADASELLQNLGTSERVMDKWPMIMTPSSQLI